MSILDAILTGLSELWSHKLRSMLTMLGVIFGVAAVIAMVSIGEGAKQEALDQIKLLGIDVIHVKRASVAGELVRKAQERSPYGLKMSDSDAIRDVCKFARQVVPVREVFAEVHIGEKPLPVKVVGTTAGYRKSMRADVEYGRFLTDSDVKKANAVCVLGASAKREIFGFNDAIGKMVKIDQRPFKVVGVMSPRGVGGGKAFAELRDVNSDVYIPIPISITDYQLYNTQAVPTTVFSLRELLTKLFVAPSIGNSPVTEIIVQLGSEHETVATSLLIQSIIDRNHKYIRDYEIMIPAELLKQSQETQRIFNIVMAAIAGISLLVGGIGIMNIMLATVTQRTREIGIRRCIGATRWDIVRQFMLEAMVITCMGGLIGVFLGVQGADAIATYAGWRTIVSMQAVVVSFGVSAIVGVVFGMYPAVRAAMVDPIEALRYS